MPISLPSNADWKKLVPVAPEFDVVVIGGGSAGFGAARVAAGLGARTAVIEGAKEVGGLCILRGCMPSKALIESSNRWHVIEHAAEFGLEARAVRTDMPRIQERKRRLVGEFAASRREQLEKGKFTFLRGRASFLDPHAPPTREGGRGAGTHHRRDFHPGHRLGHPESGRAPAWRRPVTGRVTRRWSRPRSRSGWPCWEGA